MLLRKVTALSRLSGSLVNSTATRHLSKSSQKPRSEHKHYRLWSVPGDLVLKKEVLARQYKMSWHPGLNTGIDEDRNIYALCDGVMVITEEEFDPDWEHNIVEDAYQRVGAPSHARYIHVIPKKRISEFKLIDAV